MAVKKKDIFPSEKKDRVYWTILNEAIYLEIRGGHLKWTYAELARRSHVSRSLIYYYFGKDKMNLLKEACVLFGELLAGTNKEKMQYWSEGDFVQGIREAKELFKVCPSIIPFYYLHRDKKNEIGELIRSMEKKGIKKRKKFFPHLDDAQARLLFALQFGISSFPGVKDKDLELCEQMIAIPGAKS
jgi:hypothetical protein